jgi:hypothetical protein
MSFLRGPRNGPTPVRARNPVFAIGRRVCVRLGDSNLHRVPLVDETGARVLGSLADEAQVEILAWRQRGPHGVRYQVRATEGGLEGWLAVTSLRDPTALADASAAMPEPVPREEFRGTGRRFGER